MSMTFMLAAGVVFGLLYFMRFKNQASRAEKVDSFKGKPAPCPHCASDLVVSNSWVRTAAIKKRGEIFDCKICGGESNWDFGVTPPKMVELGRKKKTPGPKPRRDDPKPPTPPKPVDPSVPVDPSEPPLPPETPDEDQETRRERRRRERRERRES